MSTMTEDRPSTTPTQTNQQATGDTAPLKPPATPDMSIRLVDALGMELTVQVKNLAGAYEMRKYFGNRGFSNPGVIPIGGFKRPYAEASIFDWSLIGAEPGEIDGDKGVWHNQSFYKIREYEEETKGLKLKAKIKYSRGAKPSDPKEITELGKGDISYVTLINFAGGGRINQNFVKKS